MYVILKEDIALRKWQKTSISYYKKNSMIAKRIAKDDLDIFLKADGKTNIKDSDSIRRLIRDGLIEECQEGKKSLSKWQELIIYNNRYIPTMNLQITGCCNYNCKHCFNAADLSSLQSRLSLEEIIDILDQALECGIHGFTITGGEPLAHPDFLQILEEINKRNMFVFDLNTNGKFLSQEILDTIKSYAWPIHIKISFDGIGFHDWMRGCIGAEKETLEAFKLCVDNHVHVMAQYNINRINLSSVNETLDKLDEIGVDIVRIIRTSESPRWEELAPNQTLSYSEYLQAVLSAMEHYLSKDMSMIFNAWQIVQISNEKKEYTFPIERPCASEDNRDKHPICGGNRRMIAVGANGRIYPCMQMSGAFDAYNKVLGDLKNIRLSEVLQDDTDYLKFICTSIEQRAAINGQCGQCQYFERCGGGCPALATAHKIKDKNLEGIFDPDPLRCTYFKEGWDVRLQELIKKYDFKLLQ